MKWAHVPSNDDPSALLVWALMFAVEDPHHSNVENILNMFEVGGEITGDPGWEISHYINNCGIEIFEVWVDPRVSGIERPSHSYDANDVRKTAREVIDAFIQANPSKSSELKQLFIPCEL